MFIPLAIAPIAALAACSSGPPNETREPDAPRTTEVGGQLRLYGTKNFEVSGGSSQWCVGSGEYDDFYYGTPVVVRNAFGRKVALGELDEGTLSPDKRICIFEFSVSGVPDQPDVFSIALSAGRGRSDFTLAQVRKDKTALWFTTGDEPSLDDPWSTEDGLTQAEADCLNARPDTWKAWDKCVG